MTRREQKGQKRTEGNSARAERETREPRTGRETERMETARDRMGDWMNLVRDQGDRGSGTRLCKGRFKGGGYGHRASEEGGRGKRRGTEKRGLGKGPADFLPGRSRRSPS